MNNNLWRLYWVSKTDLTEEVTFSFAFKIQHFPFALNIKYSWCFILKQQIEAVKFQFSQILIKTN